MEVIEALNEFCTEAVLLYRALSGLPDNELPEVFLGAFAAPRLHDRFNCPVRIEYPYLKLALRPGVERSVELISELGQLRADLALFRSGSPPAIIEFKILDEGCPPAACAVDAYKMRRLAQRCEIAAYVGALICETNERLPDRIRRLEDALGQKVVTGTTQTAVDGNWHWCFGCTRILTSG